MQQLGWSGAKSFAEKLKSLGELSELTVHINSAGGFISEGTAIYNTIKNHPANVTVEIDGIALSIASVMAMAGDTIRMAENGFFMIHNPWTIVMGEVDDLLKEVEVMELMKDTIVGTYAARTGLEAEELSKMMDEERWFDGPQAVEAGFADEISPNKAIAARFDPQLHDFKHAPDRLQPLVNSEPSKPPEGFDNRINLDKAKAVHVAKYG